MSSEINAGSLDTRKTRCEDASCNSGVVGTARNRRKLVIVGSGSCGKTSLLLVQAKRIFPEAYVPTLFENYTTKIVIRPKKVIELSLWDTAGQEDYDRLRPLSYPGTDIILLVFSVADRDSFASVVEKWYPEIHHFLKDKPIILVGSKVDLRIDAEKEEANSADSGLALNTFVSTEEGEDISNKLGAARYVECSAKTGYNVDYLFLLAAKLSIRAKKKKQGDRKCSLS